LKAGIRIWDLGKSKAIDRDGGDAGDKSKEI